MTLPNVRQLIRESLLTPKAAARRLLELPISLSESVAAMGLAVVLGTIIAEAMRLTVPSSMNRMSDMLLAQPLVAAALQFVLLLAVAAAIVAIGRFAGGRGTLPQAVLMIGWIQVVMVVIQLGQFALLFLVPPLAALVGLASVLWFFWALSAFVAELHGFDSLLKVLGMIIVSMVTILFALALLLSLLGVPLPQMS